MRQFISIGLVVLTCGMMLILIIVLFGAPVSGGKVQLAKADIQAISYGLKSYQAITGRYPTTEEGLMALVQRPQALPAERKWTQLYTRVPIDPWKNEYRYRRLADDDPRHFEIRCVGPDGIEGNGDDRSSLAR